MNNTYKLYLVLLAIVLVVIALLELNKTEVVNWSKTYAVQDKNPFGLFVFNQEVNHLLGNELLKTSIMPYDYFEKDSIYTPQNFLLINQWVTEQSNQKLLNRVELGDNLLIFSDLSWNMLSDTMGFKISTVRWETHNELKLKEEKFESISLNIDKLAGNIGMNRIDNSTTRILGSALDSENREIANFIEIKHGKGKIFYHTEPLALTNYYLLNADDYRYAESVFSYLPQRRTVWFSESEAFVNTSPLRFVLSQPALRYAWYILIFSIPFFVIFHAKRRQRIVPVIQPLKNASAEFVKTIGNLYLQEGNYKDMAQKKATYFLNKIRSELLIDTSDLDENFVQKLQLKTGAKPEIIEKAIPLLRKAIHEQAPVQQQELIELNKLLDQIYK
ncbi:MAG: hypothetical protein Q4G27_05735 [Flavobacteriaceae bacterium]|nr:hypothetical protein [Flavobacteriaceae bacterium]